MSIAPTDDVRSAGGNQALARLYDDLGRYHWYLRRLRRAGPGQGLDMHKRLRERSAGAQHGERPLCGVEELNTWLWSRIQSVDVRSVLDLGAGFGGTVFEWAQRAPSARFVGLSLSPFQVRKARVEARRLGLAERATFLVQDNRTLPAETFQVALSIETLFHAPDLNAVLERLAGRIEAGGRLCLVEDMAVGEGVGETPDGAALLELWSTHRLHSVLEYHRALEQSGFRVREEHDLSAYVPVSASAAIDRRLRRLESWQRWCPSAALRGVLAAFRGGLHLERLYASGCMGYRAIIAERVVKEGVA